MMATAELSFAPAAARAEAQAIARPSLSYWQDAWRRLKANRRAIVSLYIVLALLGFTLLGPLLWRVDPSVQDLDQISAPPGADRGAVIVAPHTPWDGVTMPPDDAADLPADELTSPPAELALAAPATTQAVRLAWRPVPGAAGYRV